MLETLLLDQETIHAAVSRVVRATEEPSVSTSYSLEPHPSWGSGFLEISILDSDFVPFTSGLSLHTYCNTLFCKMYYIDLKSM